MREIAIKSALGYIDHFVSPSEFLVNQYVKWGIPGNKISAIENPLPFRGDDSLAVKESARKSGEWRIGFFGQINYYKGVDIIVDAVKSLREKGKKIKLGIHGNFVSIASDSYVDNLKLEISELSDCITYYGPYPQDDVISLMQEYDFIVMGSRWYENSPVVIQEAIAAGVPMIVPDHGGMKEKVEDFGFVYKPSNFAAMVAVLDDMTERKYMQSKKKVFAMRAKQKAVLNESYNKICEIYMK
jgi:glycosyltransferase involved in cell wall biosynthesis